MDEEVTTMTKGLEITKKVLVGLNNGDSIPLERCVCGDVSEPWEFVLHTDPLEANKCDVCGRERWFSLEIHVWQKLREEDRLCNQPLAPYNRPISPEAFTLLSGGFPEGDYEYEEVDDGS